jgi:hypothetical protein
VGGRCCVVVGFVLVACGTRGALAGGFGKQASAARMSIKYVVHCPCPVRRGSSCRRCAHCPDTLRRPPGSSSVAAWRCHELPACLLGACIFFDRKPPQSPATTTTPLPCRLPAARLIAHRKTWLRAPASRKSARRGARTPSRGSWRNPRLCTTGARTCSNGVAPSPAGKAPLGTGCVRCGARHEPLR